MHWHNVIGTVGVVLIVGSYLLLQLRLWNTGNLSYSIANAAGAILIIISLSVEFNMPAFLIEFFWLIISLLGIITWFRKKRNNDGTH